MNTQQKLGFFSFGLRQKIGLVLLSVLLLSLGAGRWYSARQQEILVVEETIIRGNDLAKFTSQSISYAVVGYDYHSIQLLLDKLISSQDINYAKVINTEGNVMAKAGRLSVESNVWTYFEQDIIFNDIPVGTLSMQFDNSRIIENLALQQDKLITQEFFLILFIAISEFLALSFFIIRPIICASNRIKENIDNNILLSKDISYKPNDELRYLFSHFNALQHRLRSMTSQLESSVKSAHNEVKTQNALLKAQSHELQETNKKLKQLSISDPLTELFNRRHFDILLKKEISFSRRHKNNLSLIIFDIDHFKQINDHHGHSVGDTVLCAIAKNIQENTRESDICCRIGGEEFAIICRDTDEEKIRLIAESLRNKIEKHIIRNNKNEITVTASFGMMTYASTSAQSLSPDDVYHYADMAMYHSKNNGRNRVTYYSDINIHQINIKKS